MFQHRAINRNKNKKINDNILAQHPVKQLAPTQAQKEVSLPLNIRTYE